MARAITIKTLLGEKLLFASMSATEELGRLFSFHVNAQSKDGAIDLRSLLGTSMTIKATTEDGTERHFNGIVAEAGQTGFGSFKDDRYAEYSFTLVPKPWLLTRKADSRIYKNKSVPDLVKQLLGEAGYSDVRLSLRGTYPSREYCVQYRESYFNFISRLMEQEGIYYYFVHDESTHTMVLCDGLDAHQKIKPKSELIYRVADNAQIKDSSITEFSSERSVQTSKYQLTDYDYLKPRASLLTTENVSNPEEHHTVAGLDVFDFPGDYDVTVDGSRYAQVRVESLNAAHSRFVGVSDALTLATGGLFKLKNFARKELEQEYLVTSSTMTLEEGGYVSGSGGTSLSVKFHAISSKQQFRSMQETPRPCVVGLQTAVVCGSKDAEDIVVDKWGRVQVVFHWSKSDKPHHDISCPVRVSTPWAGKQWGVIHIPRVGQEVVISFLEGDPDRPLIVGSVYNADNLPPYELPANMTQSGIKSRSHKGGGSDNFNEIRFEDKKGSEEVYLHAEKVLKEMVEADHIVDIGHDEIENIKHDRIHIIDHDEKFEIKNNRTHKVGQEDKLEVGANKSADVKQKYKLTAGTEIELVTGQSSIKMTAGGDITIKGLNVTIEAGLALKMGGKMTVDMKAGIAMNLKAGVTLKMKSDVMAEFAGGAMSTVKAPMLVLTGDGLAKLAGGITMIG